MNARMIFVAMAGVLFVCVPVLAEWTEPVPVSEINTAYNDKPLFLSFDGLTLYFSRSETDTFNYARIYQATRPEPYGSFTSVEEISTLNYSEGHVYLGWVSPDNLRMYYMRVEPGSTPPPPPWPPLPPPPTGPIGRLKVTERASIYDPWLPGGNISELNALGDVYIGSLTEDELTIFFTGINLPGYQGFHIWMATRPDMNSPFGNVRNLTEINSAAGEVGPHISPDGLVLYFTSNRNGIGLCFKATRASVGELFGNIEQLSFLDSPGSSVGNAFSSSEGTALYFNKKVIGQPADGWVSYFVHPDKAFDPYPADGVAGVDPNVVLGWSEGKDALSHDVYLGTDHNDVNDATPDSNEYMGNFGDSRYDPCGLDFETTYYWRIDEINDANEEMLWKGDVWTFTTWSQFIPDLVSWWKFDEGSGTMAFDSVGNNHGIIYEATWTTGQINGALSFDGAGDYVRVPDDYSLDLGTHDLSFAFWFKTDDSALETMLGKRSTTTGPPNRVWDGYSAALLADGTVNVHFRHTYSEEKGVEVTSTTSYNDGNWHHLACVYTRSANLELYVDGVPEGTPGDISYASAADINLTQPLAIGCKVVYGWSNDNYFDGSIDEVRIYNRALSEEEIWEAYRGVWCEEGYPCIDVWPETLEFYAGEGGPNPAPQTLSVCNLGDGTLNYQIIENCPWLEVDPNSGSSTGEPNEVTISVDISSLTCGLYECDLIVSDPNASNNPQIVHVQLEVFRWDCHIDVRVVPVVVLIDPASTSEIRTTLPDSMPGVVRGNTYYIEIWASDVGTTNTGLTGVYVDVDFCEQTSALAVEHGTIFVTFPDGTIQPGGVNEFGGSALPSGGGIEPKWVRVGWIQMSAGVNTGTCIVSLSPSTTGVGALERGLIPWAFVGLDSVELQITPPVRSYDLDGDDFIGVGDLSLFAGSWQQHVPPADEEHDFDCDDSVGVGDLSWFATGWQKNTDDPTILYPPCLAGGAGALMLNNSATGMRSSNTFQTSFSSYMSEPPSDIAFGLAVLDSPSSSDTTTILPTSVKKISAGQTYYLELWVSDSGYINTGLTSAYVDLSFSADAVTVTNVSYGGIFTLFNEESVLLGKIDELGGSSLPGGDGIEPEWARVAVVQIHADTTLPVVTFTLSPSSTGVAAFGRGTIPWNDISLGSLMIYPADFDNDTDVDMMDLAIFASAYRTRPGDPQWNPDCDIFESAEDIVNTLDLAVFIDSWLVRTGP